MKLCIKDIEALAAISRVALTQEEKQTCLDELERMISFASVLENVPMEAISGYENTMASLNQLREDVAEDGLDREAVLRMASVREEEFISVPRAVEG